MNAATDFDVGPLTWVKSEIDLALGRADEALQQYEASLAGSGGGDVTQLRFCRTHLHQVQGALTIVGLDGVTQVAESVEALLQQVETQVPLQNEASIELARRALSMVRHYLDDLVAGQPNQPLKLLAVYREVRARCGIASTVATDLFFPDLTVRPPRREAVARKLAPGDYQRLLRQERMRFQRGFLAWLRAPKDRSGIGEMRVAVSRIEETLESGAARSFWWVASGFLSALAEGAVPDEMSVKQLCARIDLQIRRLLEGSKNVAERLMRDALYFVAIADSSSDPVKRVQTAYQLQTLIPRSDTKVPAPEEAVRRRLAELVSSAEETWKKYCSGTNQVLPLFVEHVSALAASIEPLERKDLVRLAQAISHVASWLSEDSSRQSETLAMEVATAVLLLKNALENLQDLGGDFAHQVDVIADRIQGCMVGRPPQPGSEIPLLDEMSRQAQEKLLVSQVAKEIQSNLGQIEQVLDGFFRDTSKRTELEGLKAPLRQVVGALTIMRHDDAVAALQTCSAEIERFVDPAYEPSESDFEQVANQLSLVGFFVDSMQLGEEDFTSFVRRIQSQGEAAEGESPLPDEEDEEAPVFVEQAVEQQKADTHALLGALKEQPHDAELREELRSNLAALKDDADLMVDTALVEQAKAALSVIDAGHAETEQIEEVMASLKPQPVNLPGPSAETIQLSQASNEEIDAELLGIFLEEANEVLVTIEENARLLVDQPHNVEYLTTIRRSFHTLKGSGRMVGLKDAGETAWAIEQTLNLWLRKELEVSPALIALVDQAHRVFVDWVRHLESGEGLPPDSSQLVAAAEALRSGDDELGVPTPAPTPATEPGEVTAAVEESELGVVSEIEIQSLPSEDEADYSEEPEGSEAWPLPIESELSGSEAGADAFVSMPPDITSSAPEVFAPEAVAEDQSVSGAEVIEVDFAAQEDSDKIEFADADFAEIPLVGDEVSATVSVEESEPVANEAVAEAVPEIGIDSQKKGAQKLTISPVLYEIFTEEASGHLETLRRELAVIERDELLPTPHAMYRAAHTLAGISATVGVDAINQLGLALEHALLRRDHSPQRTSLEAIGVIRMAVASLSEMLAEIAAQRRAEGNNALVADLEGLYPAIGVSSDVVVPATSNDAGVLAEEVPVVEGASAPVVGEPVVASPSVPVAVVLPQVADEIDEQLLPIFLEEAVDLNQNISAQLRAWRAAPSSVEPVRVLARLLHTLKGSARMAGAMRLGEITHGLETRVEDASRLGSVTPELIDELDSAFDAVQQIIERLQKGETLDQVAPPTPEVPVEAAASVVVHEAVATPAPDRRADRLRMHETEPEVDPASQRAMLRVRADLVDRLVNQAGELSIARSRIEGEMRGLKDSLLDLTENVIRLRRQLREVEIQAESQMQSRTAQTEETRTEFDPLEFDRFTRFQELTRMMAESVNDVATVQQNLLKTLDDANAAIVAQARLNRDLQQELMSVRMVPFASLADRLYRIVRQTAKELGKRVNLDIKGGQVELDRSVLEKMGAPLEHMLRNAVAHGVESREERLAKGKPEVGDVQLVLRQEGNEIILSLSDDGSGLDFDRIRTRGVAAGLIGADEDDAERLANLIFTPGFSTAEAVSQVAGRGVGMDVVKSEVGSLGGRIETVSAPDKGTEFRLYIPLTLAVTKALIVRAGSRRYAIPSVMIEQVLDLKEVALERIREAGTAEWMGHHYPFSYLPQLLGEPNALPEQHRQYWTLLLRSGTRRISVQVDELMGNEEIVVKNVGAQLARIVGIDGATVLGDGEVVLILNPVALSTRARVTEFVASGAATPVEVAEPEVATLPTVMVVDDSLTVRKITGRLLAREGYQVILAKDGVDALEQLIDVVPDVMLVDIEMPRMDGFDLTRNIRADERLKSIPIIMITSRTAEKHRAYAFEIGVNQYLGKPYHEDELLGFVAEYVKKPQRA